jgi:hypothetical protein
MTSSTLHKVYASAIALVVVLAVIVGAAWSSHVKDEAKRDAVIDAQKSDIAQLEQSIGDARKAAQEQIAALEQQKQLVIQQPSQAPTIIREQIPFSTPVMQTAPIEKATLPDAPVAQLTKQNEIDLAQYALACKQCNVDRDQLAGQVKSDEEIIGRQKTQLEASMKAAKGGSVWQRTKTILKWGAIFGGVGYAVGRSQR